MGNKSFDNVSWLLGDPITNFCMSIVDEAVRANADLHYQAGLSPKIVRTTDGKCCEWCSRLAGTYDYDKVSNTGNDVFRRHRNCGCVVEYYPGDGRKQNAHTKKWSQATDYDKIIKNRVALKPQQRTALAYMNQEGGRATIPPAVEGDFSDFASLNIAKEDRAALSNLRQKTIETGLEQGCIKRQDGTYRFVDGKEKSRIKMIVLEEDGEKVDLFHSHTNDTLPSASDFRRLVDERINSIAVTTSNGDVYVVKVGYGWRPESIDDFEQIVQSLSREADRTIREDPRFDSWTYEERNYMAIREQAYIIARYFGWELQGGKL